jgi:hypothetical protein
LWGGKHGLRLDETRELVTCFVFQVAKKKCNNFGFAKKRLNGEEISALNIEIRRL